MSLYELLAICQLPAEEVDFDFFMEVMKNNELQVVGSKLTEEKKNCPEILPLAKQYIKKA